MNSVLLAMATFIGGIVTVVSQVPTDLTDPLVFLPGFGALAAAAYVFLRVVNSDRNYEGLIGTLKKEIERKDEDIEELNKKVAELSKRVGELEFYEYVERSLRDHISKLEDFIQRYVPDANPPPPPQLSTRMQKRPLPPPPPGPKKG